MSSFSELAGGTKIPLPNGKKSSAETPKTPEVTKEVEEKKAEQPVEEQIKEIEAKAQRQIEELKLKDAQEELKKAEEKELMQKKRGRKANPERTEKDYLSVDIYGMRDALKILCMREAKARNENEIPLGVYISELVRKDIEANKEYIDTVSKYI